jgi:signal transduction histidine kinase/DNA-binding CsgD family transcriptional regulator
MVGTVQDVTERRRVEEALRMSESSLRESRNELRRLAEQLIISEEQEHLRLAIELRSEFAGRLEVLLTEAKSLERELERCRDRGTVLSIRRLRRHVGQLSAYAQRLGRRLHPVALEKSGLVKAVQAECARISKKEKMRVDFIPGDMSEDIPGHVALSLYRIVQEGPENIARHAGTGRGTVRLECHEGLLRLSVADEGAGFGPGLIKRKKGAGLVGMKERARLIDGRLTVESAPGKGTSVTVLVPAEWDEAHAPGRLTPKLSQRQADILRLLAGGLSAKEIAAALKISTRTVEFHKYRMRADLGLKTVADLIRLAVKHGLVST